MQQYTWNDRRIGAFNNLNRKNVPTKGWQQVERQFVTKGWQQVERQPVTKGWQQVERQSVTKGWQQVERHTSSKWNSCTGAFGWLAKYKGNGTSTQQSAEGLSNGMSMVCWIGWIGWIGWIEWRTPPLKTWLNWMTYAAFSAPLFAL